jgi:GTP-binding protein HflX
MNLEDYDIKFSEKATTVSVVCDNFEFHNSLEQTKSSLVELGELLRTLGIETTSSHFQNRKKVDPATMLGDGKLREIADAAKSEGSTMLVFDFELTASQMRNIRNVTGLEVVDRCMIILEIFARHARTKEAKIQIEISRLNYMLPRLQSLWTHFTKQKGGIGLKGEGEQQLEIDRRILRDRISFHKKQLKEISKHRTEQRKGRENNVVTAALVGYTNAGKSSLMNKLCDVNVLAEDKLFATLDSTYRTLNPDSKPPMVLIDTVGFIQNLPSTLVEGFRTTLESALEADLLIIVCDLSDPNYKRHLEVTQTVLSELNIENKEQIVVFNKKDKVADPFLPKIAMRNLQASFLVSSLDDTDIQNLREYVITYFLSKQKHYDLFISYSNGEAQSRILANANILNTHHHETGTYYRIRIPDFIFNQLGLKDFVLAPDDPRADLLNET